MTGTGNPCRRAAGLGLTSIAGCTSLSPRFSVRIALFSEVYWPMVSGVGVTLLRLTDALQARGHQVRVYTATYAARTGAGGPARGPSLAQRSPLPLSRCAVGVSPAARCGRGPAPVPARRRPCRHRVLPRDRGLKAARQLRLPVIASAHTDYDQYAARYGVRLGAAGRLALSPLVLRPGAPGALSVADLRGARCKPRRHPHRALEPRGGPDVFIPRFRSEAYRAVASASSPATCW